MKLDRYELKGDEPLTTFEFVSKGPKGQIQKVVQFTPVYQNIFFNLAFGDKNPLTGEIDDQTITDNGDSEKVLATVVAALYTFSDRFPEAWIYATGSTAVRTRRYRMGINKYYDIIKVDFEILGQTSDEWELYQKGKDYQAFVVQRKSINLKHEEYHRTK